MDKDELLNSPLGKDRLKLRYADLKLFGLGGFITTLSHHYFVNHTECSIDHIQDWISFELDCIPMKCQPEEHKFASWVVTQLQNSNLDTWTRRMNQLAADENQN